MAEIIVFPLTLRSPPSGRRKRTSASMISPFPLIRRAPLITRAARRMRTLRPKEAGDYLIEVLELLQDELLAARVPQHIIDDQLIAFAVAAKAAAWPGGRRRYPGENK